MIKTIDHKENDCESDVKDEMIHDIIDEIYDDINNKNVLSIFEESYKSFIDLYTL